MTDSIFQITGRKRSWRSQRRRAVLFRFNFPTAATADMVDGLRVEKAVTEKVESVIIRRTHKEKWSIIMVDDASSKSVERDDCA